MEVPTLATLAAEWCTIMKESRGVGTDYSEKDRLISGLQGDKLLLPLQIIDIQFEIILYKLCIFDIFITKML